MSNPDGPSSPNSPLKPWLGIFSRLARSEPRVEAPTPDGGVDLVDQAEAFQSLRVADVMTPRADIVAVEISTTLAEVVKAFVEAEHSRMPIFRETLDDPVGVVHIKDVVKLLAPAEGKAGPNWSEPVLHRLKREVLYVPASMRAQDLMLKMQTARAHMALVIDEFGGTDGLLTLEDLVEAVVGEIEDEHDVEAAASVVQRPGGVIEADARAPLEELESMLGGELTPPDQEEEVDTLGGLVTVLAGRVPQRGEVIPHPAGFDFEVIDADPRRVKRLRVRRVERAEPAPATEGA
ncbi:hemolysin family protein [Caulobacter sp. 17J65-9]|uniref:hemolysin family protein n=1 Tax=Caulobacter sp. 17J65-9 TaxID=2709382 RepID=UPI0013C887AB|nr:hemolysin family protein [Caulobacter sp. 17J65-9]NEX94251.1 HlyC/CorC family transporter [Caulobacter sp. 17J65-9]